MQRLCFAGWVGYHSAMTIRAILIGLFGALLIAGFGYINDCVLDQSPLVGNHFPISVFGLLVLIVMVNPILGRLRFHAGELAVIVMLMLIGCSVPGSSMMRPLTSTLTQPVNNEYSRVGWQRSELLNRVPEHLLVGRIEDPDRPGQYKPDPIVMEYFLTGYQDSDAPLPLASAMDGRIPWGRWMPALLAWVPLIALTGLGAIFLAMIVHPQWSKREHLRYPLVTFASTLMGQTKSGSILKHRLFWIGMGGIFLIHLINGLHAWFPEFIEVPMNLDFSMIPRKWPEVGLWPGSRDVFFVTLFPTVIAFSFFLASDMSFSLGISRILPTLILPFLIARGVRMDGPAMTGGPTGWLVFGGYLGMAAMMLYAGRRYYWTTLRCALTCGENDASERYAIWACRGLIVCVIGLMVMMVAWMNLPWPFALVTVLLVYLMFTVLSRMIAESGLFFLQPGWLPVAIVIGLLGREAVGIDAILVMGMICALLVIDPRTSVMPFMVTGLKLCEKSDIQPRKIGRVVPLVFILSIAVAVPLVIWSNYQHGFPTQNDWKGQVRIPIMPFEAGQNASETLSANDQLAASDARTTMGRMAGLWQWYPDKGGFMLWTFVGLALVVGVSVLRLRLTWWPLHPIIFLVWSESPIAWFSASFLIGWMIRTAVHRIGGESAYRKTRILMVGCIAGDLVGGLVFLTHGIIYSAVTHLPPEPYSIFP